MSPLYDSYYYLWQITGVSYYTHSTSDLQDTRYSLPYWVHQDVIVC